MKIEETAHGAERPVKAKVGLRGRQILNFLSGRDWTSPTEIGNRVWGPGHHSAAASPVCKRLVCYGLLDRNSSGHYRLTPNATAQATARHEVSHDE